MATIIEDPEIGNYYKFLVPYVEKMCVSLDIKNKTYSLECDKTYNQNQFIGLFYGYPGSIGSDGKFVPGINNANGLICICDENHNCMEVSNGIIKPFSIEELNLEKPQQNSIPSSKCILKPYCTTVECAINSNSELEIYSSNVNSDINSELEIYSSDTNSDTNSDTYQESNKICGTFFGTPGEYYYDSNLKIYNRMYGNEHSTGIITLYGKFNFKYEYNKGQILTYVIKKKIY